MVRTKEGIHSNEKRRSAPCTLLHPRLTSRTMTSGSKRCVFRRALIIVASFLFAQSAVGQTKENGSSPAAALEPSDMSAPSARGSDEPAATPPPSVDAPAASPAGAACCVHEGFYLRASSGYGYFSIWGNGPSGTASLSSLGKSFGLALGGAVAPGLAVAGTLRSTVATASFQGGPYEHAEVVSTEGKRLSPASGDAETALVTLGVLLDWYPNQRGGWHVGGLLGPGAAAVIPRASGSAMANFVWSGSVFGGYDFWMGNTWSAGVMLVATAANRTMLRDNEGRDSGYQLQPLALGLEASFVLY